MSTTAEINQIALDDTLSDLYAMAKALRERADNLDRFAERVQGEIDAARLSPGQIRALIQNVANAVQDANHGMHRASDSGVRAVQDAAALRPCSM